MQTSLSRCALTEALVCFDLDGGLCLSHPSREQFSVCANRPGKVVNKEEIIGEIENK